MDAELTIGTSEPPIDCYTPDDKIPKALTAGEWMRLLNMKPSAFYAARRRGQFDALRLPRRIGQKQYSGHLCKQYLQSQGSKKRGR